VISLIAYITGMIGGLIFIGALVAWYNFAFRCPAPGDDDD
jgi:hypothetical protein